MKNKKIIYPPFIRKRDSVSSVMLDVVIALVPVILVSSVAYGVKPLLVLGVSVVTALLTEFLFMLLIHRKVSSIKDSSALVTGVLLALTIGPFTPLGMVAFGACSAVLFGKLLWGGLGRNTFNPALMGREFMTIFFPVVMNSELIYFDASSIKMQEIFWFQNHFINQLFFQVSGAIGEYSVVLLFSGGLYLLFRRRISWHIPVGVMVAFTIMLVIFSDPVIRFSLGAIFLGSIYMATDMPTSPSSPMGKVYFGSMVGVICVLCLVHDIPRGYLSYAILLMNLFTAVVDHVFRPVVWGHKVAWTTVTWQSLALTIVILLSTWGVIVLHHADGIKYLVSLFIVYTLGRYLLLKYRNRL